MNTRIGFYFLLATCLFSCTEAGEQSQKKMVNSKYAIIAPYYVFKIGTEEDRGYLHYIFLRDSLKNEDAYIKFANEYRDSVTHDRPVASVIFITCTPLGDGERKYDSEEQGSLDYCIKLKLYYELYNKINGLTGISYWKNGEIIQEKKFK